MDYSYEEIYLNSGQFDPIVHITFNVNSDAHKRHGYQVMGTVLYTHEERKQLQELIDNKKKEEFPRTDGKVRFKLSPVDNWVEAKAQELEQHGFSCSDIFLITDYGWNRKNRFVEKGEKEIIANKYTIEIDNKGWSYKGLLKGLHGQLDRRISEGNSLAPFETAELLAYRKILELDNTIEPYATLIKGIEEEVEFFYLKSLYSIYQNDENIEVEDIDQEAVKELGKIFFERLKKRIKTIEDEVEKSGDNIKNLVEKYKIELDHIKRGTVGFEGESFNKYGKLVYLTFEGLVHIYARHVEDMYIQGKREDEAKTFFQYKVADILSILRFNVEAMKDEIDAHFKATPDKRFFRIGKRANYYDGHYYRIDIDLDGNIAGFHPFNNNGPVEEPL
ncbi:hypothetical protein Dfri01_46560 [Dyadobacter frigoris]|uniref:hypothetical protein n=1 Tax=Dyadobacter frigoris TaxID=2576211 RepID=UPI0024A3EDDA|nr:hypothetical protein [Dyadobacter frigoris]GLU55195.1 hypothetical protein Dfri01_46560 [Dyadobacter frigoris]